MIDEQIKLMDASFKLWCCFVLTCDKSLSHHMVIHSVFFCFTYFENQALFQSSTWQGAARSDVCSYTFIYKQELQKKTHNINHLKIFFIFRHTCLKHRRCVRFLVHSLLRQPSNCSLRLRRRACSAP